jgi:hypothetical protein
LCNLSNLTDIFEKLNGLNTSLQSENANILLLHDTVTTFVNKISILMMEAARTSETLINFYQTTPLITLMMEAARTSETLVNFYQITRRYNPEDSHLRTHRR